MFPIAFPWQPVHGDLTPVLPVTMYGADGQAEQLTPIVDSGSPVSAFPLAVAERLGIELEPLRRTTHTPFLGEQRTWVPLGEAFVRFSFLDVTFELIPRFLEDKELPAHPVLGRDDFWMVFRVEIDPPGQRTIIHGVRAGAPLRVEGASADGASA